MYERGYQAGKESQFVLLPYSRGVLKHGRDHKPFSFVSEKDSQPGKYFSSVHGFRPTHCFTRHTKSIVFPRYSTTQTSSIDEFLYPIYKNSNRNLLIPSVLVESLDKFPLIRRMIFWGPFVFMTKNIPPSVIR